MAKFSFSFNLLPPKSKELIAKEDKRSSTLFYSSVLLFSITVVWALISLLNAWLKSAEVKKFQDINNTKDTEITSYNQYASDNYELYNKSNVLGSVVLRNTDPDLVFDLINNRIKESTPSVAIIKYGRNATGNYQVTGQTNDIDNVAKLIKDFKTETNVKDVSLISLHQNDAEYEFVLDLAIIESSSSSTAMN